MPENTFEIDLKLAILSLQAFSIHIFRDGFFLGAHENRIRVS
jgi:hypothetical protein